ncbi:PSD1 and planctomycete cytochrome C domain-containing protein [Gemmata sp.]|uniref:PSD1 and planctomycete cytochrome C domain-containing protein n=1 Tax=Gemmata sp. TaxID=1914242 RepID=UPI003F7151BD
MTGRVALAILAITPGLSRAADPAPTPAAIEHFEKKVRPVLVEHCAKCHGADPKKIKGGLSVASRADLITGGDTGTAVVPGNPDKSPLVQVMRYEGEMKMPPKGKLRDADIAAVADWVRAGALWPDSGGAAASATPKPAGPLFTDEQKQFWAFQPVKRPAVPAGTAASAVDAFLAAKRAAAGLKMAPEADKRTLIRRVTYDLTGLPPTPEEVDAFEKDPSPDAYKRVVDRLLDSPAYGERWGRHWLDVARYADSNGLDENTAFGNAWKYRDYVIRSFNADKPFDAFLREQIAGDLLPPTTDEAVRRDRLTALGYLAIGAKLLAEPDKQKMLIDIADEQLDTLGKGIMGLTLGCARCHDHKFDPLPTRDYYSLLGVFTSTRTMQGLGTVAQAFERPLGAPEKPQVAVARKKLDDFRKSIRDLERQAAKLAPGDAEWRTIIATEIDRLRAEIEGADELVPEARLERLRGEVRDIEVAFGKVPEKDQAKRLELHHRAEARRTEIKRLETLVVPPDIVLGVEEGSPGAYGTQPRNIFVQVRGNYVTPGEEAPAQFLRIVTGEAASPVVATTPNTAEKPQANRTRFGSVRASSGRLELANWLTDGKHPLTARVFVNRVWQHHFGEGIVRTVDNFGKLGDRPTHPELLDWLASEFVARGWSVKHLHRVILLSAAYRQAGTHDAKAALADPDNRLLWRFPRQRLDAEAIRDGVLAAAGTLDRTTGGTLLPTKNFEYVTTDQSGNRVGYESLRRSVYLPVVRNNVFAFFQTFDFPDPSTMSGKRVNTVVAPQALYLLNSPFVAAQAKAFAARLLKAEPTDDEARVALAYRLALGRPPVSAEVRDALDFVKAFEAGLTAENDAPTRKARAWAALGRAVFASNEFVYVE